jgi:hypothetical protein
MGDNVFGFENSAVQHFAETGRCRHRAGTNGIRFLAGMELLLDRDVIQQQKHDLCRRGLGSFRYLYVTNSVFTQGPIGIKVATSIATVSNSSFSTAAIQVTSANGIANVNNSTIANSERH